jgi:hypothetical protein
MTHSLKALHQAIRNLSFHADYFLSESSEQAREAMGIWADAMRDADIEALTA